MSQSDLITLISAAAGVILSLATTYYKPLATWFYTKIPADLRGLSMFAVSVLGALAVFGLSCSTLFSFVACTGASAVELVRALAVMFVLNQATYLATPDSKFKPVK
jgi:hypothetical protein